VIMRCALPTFGMAKLLSKLICSHRAWSKKD
jgi:hypothetical protein